MDAAYHQLCTECMGLIHVWDSEGKGELKDGIRNATLCGGGVTAWASDWLYYSFT